MPKEGKEAKRRKVNAKKLLALSPKIIEGHNGFRPSRLMQLSLWAWVHQNRPEIRELLQEIDGVNFKEKTDSILSLRQIVVALGYCKQNIERWTHAPGWKEWFDATVETLLKKNLLPRVHINLLQRAETTRDSSLIKLALERFDPEYSPRSVRDNKHTFAGYEPAGAARSEERQRKALAERKKQDAAKAPIPVESTMIKPPPTGFEPVAENENKSVSHSKP